MRCASSEFDSDEWAMSLAQVGLYNFHGMKFGENAEELQYFLNGSDDPQKSTTALVEFPDSTKGVVDFELRFLDKIMDK